MSLKFAPLALMASMALVAPAAQAVILDSVQGHTFGASGSGFTQFVNAEGEVGASDASSFGNVASDVFLSAATSPLTLNYVLEEGEGTLAYASVVSFLPYEAGFTGVQLDLSGGATFSFLGSVTTLNSLSTPTITLSSDARSALITMPVSEDEVYLGSPFGGLLNWGIDVGGVGTTGQFSLTVSAVPEPGSLALALAGLGVSGLLARRRAAR